MQLKNKYFTIKKDNIHKTFSIFGIKISVLRIKHLKKEYIPKLETEIIKLKNNTKHLTQKVNILKKEVNTLKNRYNAFKNADIELQEYIIQNKLFGIEKKLIPQPVEQMRIEVNLVDHCNLNCKFCDHFSPIAEPYYLSIEEFEKDIKQLAKLTNNKLGGLSLIGGEPLLNKDIIEFLRISRKYLPETVIDVVSNGILLLNNETLWDALAKYKIKLYITTYPINIDYGRIDEIAKEKQIKYKRFYMFGTNLKEKISVHHPFNLRGDINKNVYIECYHFNKCITLRHGKIFTCPIIPYSQHFNKYFKQNLEISPNDYIDIYKTKSYEEIANFCATRPNFCRYCDVKNRKEFPYGQSKKEISEWT